MTEDKSEPLYCVSNVVKSDQDDEHLPPRNRIEHILVEVWSMLLMTDYVGVFDNFFDLGGNSIVAIGIVQRAHELGLIVPIAAIFEEQTIARISKFAELASTDSPSERQ